MSDDFENRINAAAARAKTQQARKAEDADKQKTAKGKRVQLVRDAAGRAHLFALDLDCNVSAKE
jgi:hypothetical protein